MKHIINLTKSYFGFFIKKFHYISICENRYQYVFSQHIEGIIKAKVHEQIKQSDYVLFSFAKKFLKKSLENATNSSSIGSYGVKRVRRKYLANSCRKGGEIMQSSFFEKVIEAQFDSLTKKVIKYERSKYYRDISRHWRNEILFSDLLEVEFENLYNIDKYPSDYTAFNVFGMEVQIMDEQLSKVLKVLPEKKRNIILLSYFLDMSDLEIGELMNLVRSTIYRHRTSILKEIKKLYKEELEYEEE